MPYLPELVDRRLRTSETFTHFQIEHLHRGNAIAYLSNPTVDGLTSIDQAWLKNFNSTENLVSHILIPAAREATLHGTIDTFADRVGSLIARWQQYDPDHQRSNDILTHTLITQEVIPETEDHYGTVMAHYFSIGYLAGQFNKFTDQYREGNYSEDIVRGARRYAGALRKKVEYSSKNHLTDILEPAKFEIIRSQMASHLQQKMTSNEDLSNPQLVQIRNDYSIAVITIASEQEITNVKLIDSNILIAALSDNQPNSRAARRAADELVRRCHLPHQETNIAIITNILSLPIIPQTGRILQRLYREVLTEARYKMNVYNRVANIAGGLINLLADPELKLGKLNDLRSIMDGLSVILQVPVSETTPPADLIEDIIIDEDTATKLIETLLNAYLVRPQLMEEHDVRFSLVNLAASLACGYTRRMTDTRMVLLVDQVRQKRDRDQGYYSDILTGERIYYDTYRNDINFPNRSEDLAIELLYARTNNLTVPPPSQWV